MEGKVSLKDNLFSLGQQLGKAIMMPISILPVAGLLLGISAALSSGAAIKAYSVLDNAALQGLLKLMNAVGNGVFAALPLIFAVGIAAGLAKNEKGSAGLSAVVGYFVLLTGTGAFISIFGKGAPAGADIRLYGQAVQFGIKTLNMNVFGGVLAGIVTGVVHNKYYKTKLPDVLAFFGGSRFVPIVNTIVFMVISLIMVFVWPAIAAMIAYFGVLTQGLGIFGAFIYGLVLRGFYVLGLHHVFYLPFWQTAVGGTMEVGGKLIQGGQNIFFAQLADSAHITHFSADATRYFSGEFIFMIFGLPGAALAMYRTAKPEKKKAAGGLLLSAALTCMLTGITEPLEFSFLFVAPVLFAVQVVLAGSAYMIAHILNIAVGLTFSGGFLDLLLFGILQGNAKTSWIRIIPVGIIYFFLYYFIFSFLIKKLDLKTPGREDNDEETKLYTKADVNARKAGNTEAGATAGSEDSLSAEITRGLGGSANIEDVDCCATRLRCTVSNPDLVNDGILKATGASGVVHRGQGVQVIYVRARGAVWC